MTETGKEFQSHLWVKREIARRASELKRADGSLPPERELSTLLGVCRVTVRKALDSLIVDSFIINVPRKGNFLTGAKPRFQVALFSQGYNLPLSKTCAGVLEVLGETTCNVCSINLREAAAIPSLIREYGLAGALFDRPSDEVCELLAVESSQTPFVVLSPWSRPAALSSDWLSFALSGDARAEFMLSRGAKRVIYAGRGDGENYALFKATLAKAGVAHGRELLADDDELVDVQISGILDDGGADGLVADGGIVHLEKIVRAVSSHPKGASLKLELPDIPEVHDLMRRFPKARVAGLLRHPFAELGRIAAKRLLERMANPSADRKPLLLPSEVVPLDAVWRTK